MPRFMLDTDTCSYIMKRSHPQVIKRLQSVAVGDVCMSVVTKAELLYGVEVSPRRAQDAAALDAFLPYVEALDLTADAAMHYAEIRADLKRRGTMIGANDLFIAAHARAQDLTLVTNNTAEFGRVKGLTVENWTLPRRRSRSTIDE
jgi:tRNA(fMet)-specific endonuclease VapC